MRKALFFVAGLALSFTAFCQPTILNAPVGIGGSPAGYTFDVQMVSQPFMRLHTTSFTNMPSVLTPMTGIVFSQENGDKTAGITAAVPPGYHVPGLLFSTKTAWNSPGAGAMVWNHRMYIHPNGNVGIGVTNPLNNLHVQGALRLDTNNPLPDAVAAGATTNYSSRYSLKLSAANNGFFIALSNVANERKTYIQSGHEDPNYAYGVGPIVLNPFGGNIGIGTGTQNPTEKLTVYGTTYAREVRVDLNVPGPDYVFESNYQLPKLSEVEEYVLQNKHLPEVPSAKEMEQKGIQLSEMNMLLLKKVEELTLHLIRQEKEIEELRRAIKL